MSQPITTKEILKIVKEIFEAPRKPERNITLWTIDVAYVEEFHRLMQEEANQLFANSSSKRHVGNYKKALKIKTKSNKVVHLKKNIAHFDSKRRF